MGARAMHYILYLLLVTMMLAGFAKFGLRVMPQISSVYSRSRPLSPSLKSWRPIANTVHYWGAWTIIVVAALHALAALFHHYALHDDVLRRMLPSSRPIKAH